MNDQCNSKMDNQLWNDSIISQSPVKNTSVILQKQVAEYNTLRTQDIARRKNFGSDVFKELMVQYGLKKRPYYTEPRNEGQKVLMLYHNYELTSLIYINLIYE